MMIPMPHFSDMSTWRSRYPFGLPVRAVWLISALLLIGFARSAAAQFPAFPPSSCVSNIENATVIILEQASTDVTSATELQDGDPVIAVTPDEQTCTGESTLSVNTRVSFAIAEDDPTSSTPGYRTGDAIRFWAEAQNGFVYELTPVLRTCQPGETLCVDEPEYQTDGIYTVEGFTTVLLPVELAQFEVQNDDGRGILLWRTLSETNNHGFRIEMTARDIRGLSGWREIGFVEGAGTSTAPRSYRFSTDRLAPGTYRFRLIQIDEDGSEEMVGERQLTVRGAFDVLSAPSPHPMLANTTVSLTTDQTETVRVVLYNTLGQHVAVIYDGIVRSRQPTNFTIQVEGLASGLYVLDATGETFRSTHRIFVIR